MHLGHRALILALKNLAEYNELTTHVVTFTPHPRDYFAKQGRGSPVLNISSVRNRLMYLNKMGVDHVHLLRFNQDLATLSPQDFVRHVLVKACNAKHVLVGRDVRFGHQRAGDWALLCSLGQQYSFAVHCFEEVLDNAALRISSSAIRHDLYAGHLDDANLLLGYAYSLSGRVIHGQKLGRTLNCPTLNINLHVSNPALRGVFVVAIEGLNSQSTSRLYGVANLGIRPTVEQAQRFSLEVHVLDWSGDAYGLTVNIIFLHKLRGEAVYANLSDLQHAIAQDILNARQWLSV
jgi:riboflavin kinase/FMN adenylyltransferase